MSGSAQAFLAQALELKLQGLDLAKGLHVFRLTPRSPPGVALGLRPGDAGAEGVEFFVQHHDAGCAQPRPAVCAEPR